MQSTRHDPNLAALQAGAGLPGHVLDVVVLSSDPGVLATLREAAGPEHAIWQAPSADSAVGGGGLPDRVLRTGRLAQSGEHARIRAEHYDVENVSGKAGAGLQRSEVGIVPRALHSILLSLTRGRRPTARSGCAS